MNDTQVHEVLRRSPVFGVLPPPERAALVGQLRVQRLPAGARLFSEGDIGHSLYIVLEGQLRVSRTGDTNDLLLYNVLGPGDVSGVAALLLEQARTADLVALRDATVAELPLAGYEHLLRLNPLVFSRLFVQALQNHLRHFQPADEGQRAPTIAIVPLQPGPEAQMLARDLHLAFGAFGGCALMEPSGDTSTDLDVAQAMLRIDHHDRQSEVLLIRAEPAANPWTRLALRQADHILFVATPGTSPLPGPLERRLREEAGFDFKRQHLVVVYPEGSAHPSPTRPWRQDRPRLERVLPLRRHHADDLGRLARLLIGRAIGVVLGGGGARGLASLGVMRALAEAGMPVDLLGGHSMGALIGSQWALGHGLDAIASRVVDLMTQPDRPTQPVVSLLSGRRMEQGLRRLCDHAQIDGLWTPFFITACNLSRAATTVLDHGPLWRAVLASNSPPGLLPPVLYDGDLLVDGAALDHVPVEAMRQRLSAPMERRRGHGTVIAIDVDVQELPGSSSAPAQVRGTPDGGQSMPGLGNILQLAGQVSGHLQKQKTAKLADFHLEPPVSDFALNDYQRSSEIIERGYNHAVQAIANWDVRPPARR
ncbi:MAG: cyclic nucleotide-binding and patatin-like phospholipase domain-containing protein [Inhella sp.]|jgi:NTE family protein/lysophospholipid hydrolase|uniref:patatin-like phospholipase family protein n=1 Tax=Inhella sp. TaxID=1921806 RepID=UPI0022BD58B4|nr:cyclic nucleotide-binding and patatin-like phospholipase domain-containing protein [Inhella sp.]MCZ8235744.1 cyclic nucleotide-binding and patatin-like phospholipase domain-containing protein [Inhella sp.]